MQVFVSELVRLIFEGLQYKTKTITKKTLYDIGSAPALLFENTTEAAVDSSSISLKKFFDKKLCQAFGKTITGTVRILVTSGAKAFIIPIFFVILFEVLTVRMCGSF